MEHTQQKAQAKRAEETTEQCDHCLEQGQVQHQAALQREPLLKLKVEELQMLLDSKQASSI